MASSTSTLHVPETPKGSAVARLLIAPITFVSFVLSLALIDSRNASFRNSIHAPSNPAASETLFGRIKNNMHSWVYKPQPYAYVKSPDILQRQKSGVTVNEGAPREEPWHWNTKQKSMMKMEIADAFEMRTQVVLAMAVAVAAFAALAVWFVGWSYGVIKNYM